VKPRIEEMRDHVTRLLEDNKILVRRWTRGGGAAWSKKREVELMPIKSEWAYATALHEIGHILGRHQGSRFKIVHERWAWKWAQANALSWTPQTERRRQWCLATYEQTIAARPDRKFCMGRDDPRRRELEKARERELLKWTRIAKREAAALRTNEGTNKKTNKGTNKALVEVLRELGWSAASFRVNCIVTPSDPAKAPTRLDTRMEHFVVVILDEEYLCDASIEPPIVLKLNKAWWQFGEKPATVVGTCNGGCVSYTPLTPGDRLEASEALDHKNWEGIADAIRGHIPEAAHRRIPKCPH